MNNVSRIPSLSDVTFDGPLFWFAELHTRGLLFHPEDDPAEIVSIANGTPFFSPEEVSELRFVIETLDESLGHEALTEAAYPIFMNAMGIQLDA